jgi:hypothetical protein
MLVRTAGQLGLSPRALARTDRRVEWSRDTGTGYFTGTHAPRPQRRSSSSITTSDTNPSSAGTPQEEPKTCAEHSSTAHADSELNACNARARRPVYERQHAQRPSDLELLSTSTSSVTHLWPETWKFRRTRSVPTSPGTSPSHRYVSRNRTKPIDTPTDVPIELEHTREQPILQPNVVEFSRFYSFSNFGRAKIPTNSCTLCRAVQS